MQTGEKQLQRPPSEVFEKPKPPPVPYLNHELSKAYIGIVYKYINMRGWQRRLLVLDRGILKYYRPYNTDSVNVSDIVGNLEQQGTLERIGPGLQVLLNQEEKGQRSQNASQNGGDVAPRSEAHMQVTNVYQSKSDARRFKLNTGSSTYIFRAESEQDKDLWVKALNISKIYFGNGESATSLLPRSSNLHMDLSNGKERDFQELLGDLEHMLRNSSNGASKPILDMFSQQHSLYTEQIRKEQDMRMQLVKYVCELEADKRQLEDMFTANTIREAGAGYTPVASEGNAGSDLCPSDENDTGEPDADAEGDYFDPLPDKDGDRWWDPAEGFEMERRLNETASMMEARSPEGPTPDVKTLPEWTRTEPPSSKRESLPVPVEQVQRVSLWQIIKDMIGKDLTRVCLPVYFNEPLSALQKTCEDLEYSYLMDEAHNAPKGSYQRLMHVAAFAISGYSCTGGGRITKPFNPLLQETFEFVNPEQGYRFISEKVVHHPTIIACCAQGNGWTIDADGEVRSKFLGRVIELRPVGRLVATFDDGEVISWSKVTTSINNVILGFNRMYVDHGGVMRLQSNQDIAMPVQFKQNMLSRCSQVTGHIEKEGKRVKGPLLEGYWDKHLRADFGDGQEARIIWEKGPPPDNPTRYHFTRYTMRLNDLFPSLEAKLAPTDSRLRPDQRLTEIGQYSKAQAEKLRLEQKQRAARARQEAGEELLPKWFKRVEGAKMGTELSYKYSGGYWEARNNGKFTGCRDIFGVDGAGAKDG